MCATSLKSSAFDYILEGSVRKANERVRINAQLVDASTGGHLWADRYDGSLSDLFDLQDTVTGKIAEALRVRLTSREQAIVTGRHTDNVAAYDAFLQGRAHMLRKSPRDSIEAMLFFERAVELDPDYHRAYAAIAQIYWENSYNEEFNNLRLAAIGAPGIISPIEYMNEENAWVNLRKARGESSPQAHALTARMHLRQRRYDEAMLEADRAVALGRNDPTAYDALIETLIYSGQAERAISVIDDTIRLDPNLPGEKLFLKGLAYYSLREYERAISLIDRALRHNPQKKRYAAVRAATLAELGRNEDARNALDEYLSGWATYTTLDWITIHWPFQDSDVTERLTNGLINAGFSSYRQNSLPGVAARQDDRRRDQGFACRQDDDRHRPRTGGVWRMSSRSRGTQSDRSPNRDFSLTFDRANPASKMICFAIPGGSMVTFVSPFIETVSAPERPGASMCSSR